MFSGWWEDEASEKARGKPCAMCGIYKVALWLDRKVKMS